MKLPLQANSSKQLQSAAFFCQQSKRKAMPAQESKRLVETFGQRVEYLRCSTAAASGNSTQREALSEGISKQLVGELGKAKLDGREASDMFSMISGPHFSDEQRTFVASSWTFCFSALLFSFAF